MIFSEDKQYLKCLIPQIKHYLQSNLKLSLHPNKIFIKTLNSVDYLGWVNFFGYRILRNKTKIRMFEKVKQNHKLEMLNSYFGILKHGKTGEDRKKLLKIILKLNTF